MQFKELNATGTFYLKVGPGYFQGIQVNLAATTVTLQIFDATTTSDTSTMIAGGTAFALPAVGATPFYGYDCNFSKGLIVVVGGSGTFSLTPTWY
jgi:hypothetical protein